MRIVVIASTNGGVLSKLLTIKYFREKIRCVISDRECGAIEVAEKNGIETKILKSLTGEEFSNRILKEIEISGVDLFISFYTKLFKGPFIKETYSKVINMHPSLLPAFPGMDGFGDAIKSGVKFIGSTIHFVDEGVDTGLPIIQSAIPFDRSKTFDELRHMVFVDQCRTLLQVVKWFEEKRIKIIDNKVVVEKALYGQGFYSPKLDFEDAISLNVPDPNTTVVPKNEIPNIDNESIIDLRSGTNHPNSLIYSEIFRNALLTGKLVHGRSQPGFGLKGKSPFVLAADSGVEYGIEKQGMIFAIEEVLSEYYEKVKPKSAAEWLGLSLAEDNKLTQSPPWAAVFPWRARTLESYQQAYEKAALKENKVVGTMLDITKGWLFCGPVSAEKIRVEAMRMEYVLKQISKDGYKRSNSQEGGTSKQLHSSMIPANGGG